MRHWMRAAAFLVVTASFAGQPLPAGAAVNPIVAENQQPGTTTWQLNRAGFTTADDVSQQIKGYASASSVNKGDSIAFSVSVNPAQTFTIDIYRVGWYGGTGGRLMQHIGPLNGVRQPTCPTDATTGMIECRWPAAVSVSIPTTWTSGMYLVLLTNAANYQNYVPFVVRDDSRTAALQIGRASCRERV